MVEAEMDLELLSTRVGVPNFEFAFNSEVFSNMVMHSNERGEYCPRPRVDCKRKRYDNAVDVVVHLHDPTDPSTKGTAPP